MSYPTKCVVNVSYYGKTSLGGQSFGICFLTGKCHFGYNNYSIQNMDSPIDLNIFHNNHIITISFRVSPELFYEMLYMESKLDKCIEISDLNDENKYEHKLKDFLIKVISKYISCGSPLFCNIEL